MKPRLPTREKRPGRGFTLVELVVGLAIVAVLVAVAASGYRLVVSKAQGAKCAAGLRQLGAAHQLYMADHNGRFVPFKQRTQNGTVWYFGLETGSGGPEGERDLDRDAGPLAPYLGEVGLIETCPSFNYGSALYKPKFKGASWGYGYNWRLGGGPSGRHPKHITAVRDLARIVVFGDCAQANTFQSPASPENPLLEEFYIVNETFKTVHFRHGRRANFLFADGHIDALPMAPGTGDPRLPGEQLGLLAPEGDLRYLESPR